MSPQLTFILSKIVPALFVFAFGACAGSLINVLVYRLPRGLSVVRPPSACPACGTNLTWRENIPIFGWIFLRGRCRFCRSAISPEYPLVEAFTAVLMTGFFLLYWQTGTNAEWLGVRWGAIRPDWMMPHAPGLIWPTFAMLLLLLGSLVAMTLVDAKTFTIPLQLPWFIAIMGVVVHTAHAAWVEWKVGSLVRHAPGWDWVIPTPSAGVGAGPNGWWWAGACLGAMAGLGVSLLLVRAGLIRRSYLDYDEWEAKELAARGISLDDPDDGPPTDWRLVLSRTFVAMVAIGAAMAAGYSVGVATGRPAWAGPLVGLLVGPVAVGIVLRASARGGDRGSARAPGVNAADGSEVKDGGEPQETASKEKTIAPDLWIAYPHARREALKEFVFLSPPVCLGALAGWAAARWLGDEAMPLWLAALTGSLMGYLIGGAVVWAVRIGGTLAFDKDAMGLGDVHMVAGIGACLGWIDATLAFFGAAFVGLYWWVAQRAWTGKAGRAMPYGPFIAVAAVLVILGRPLIEAGLNRLLPPGPGQAPIYLP